MKNIWQDIKSSVGRFFYKDKEDASSKTKESFVNKEPVQPGLEDKSEDVGKKVFEKTGQIREGVGQSSTLRPRETPDKLLQTRRAQYKKYKKNYGKNRTKNKENKEG